MMEPVKLLSAALVAGFLALIGIIFTLAYYEEKEHTRLIAQCMQDGKKEYECRAMFRGNGNRTVVMPMVVGR